MKILYAVSHSIEYLIVDYETNTYTYEALENLIRNGVESAYRTSVKNFKYNGLKTYDVDSFLDYLETDENKKLIRIAEINDEVLKNLKTTHPELFV